MNLYIYIYVISFFFYIYMSSIATLVPLLSDPAVCWVKEDDSGKPAQAADLIAVSSESDAILNSLSKNPV